MKTLTLLLTLISFSSFAETESGLRELCHPSGFTIQQRDQCVSSCREHLTSSDVAPLYDCVNGFIRNTPNTISFDEEEERTVVGNPNAAPTREACLVATEENREACQRRCSGTNTQAQLNRCAQSFRVNYSWTEDQNGRKIIHSRVGCGDNKICIGQVRYTNAEGVEETRLAVCGAENCGDDDASVCARQGGYGSMSFNDYQEQRRPRRRSQPTSTSSDEAVRE